MNARALRFWGAVLLAVVAAACLHSFIDRDHLRFEHRPVGVSFSASRDVEHDVCLCFSHGLFLPEFSVPADNGRRSLETPFLSWAESPLTATAGEIDHPPLA